MTQDYEGRGLMEIMIDKGFTWAVRMLKLSAMAILWVTLGVGLVFTHGGCQGISPEQWQAGGRLAIDVVQIIAQIRGERLNRDEARAVARGENRERYLRLARALAEGVSYVERNCGRDPALSETVIISVGGRKAVVTTTCLLEAQLHVEGWYLDRYRIRIREDLDFLSGSSVDPRQSDLELFLSLLNGYMEPGTTQAGFSHKQATELNRIVELLTDRLDVLEAQDSLESPSQE